MRPGVRTALPVVLLVLLAALSAPSALAAAKLPTLLGNALKGPNKLLVRPAQIVYTGDGSGILGGFDGGKGKGFGHLHWTKWTSTKALGHGADWVNGCTPNCAQGTYTANAATLVAFRPEAGHFTRLTMRTHYRGKPVVSRMTLVKSGGAWFYRLPVPKS